MMALVELSLVDGRGLAGSSWNVVVITEVIITTTPTSNHTRGRGLYQSETNSRNQTLLQAIDQAFNLEQPQFPFPNT